MQQQRYSRIDQLPLELPVFPLAGTILLPRATLPLNIFEPRYLDMIDDAIRGERMIGIIQPVGEGGPTGSPQSRTVGLRNVGCCGRITTFQEADDGRMLIALTGVSRFRPGQELATEKPYRIVRADYHSFALDLDAGHGEAEVDRDRLLDALRRYLSQRGLQADWQSIAKSSSEHLVNWLAVASPFAPEEKQALVEAGTLKERAEILIALAEMDLACGGDGSSGTRLQ
jgi:Lon protease-like protein